MTTRLLIQITVPHNRGLQYKISALHGADYRVRVTAVTVARANFVECVAATPFISETAVTSA